ncbi:MAG: site-specific integrase [Clostridiales bacterium]|nr:site-specific integrase [Clostridiales bacterium]
MAKGENIFKRKDGRWEARYIKGYELSGKIRYGFCYGRTYKEAKEKVTAAKAALINGKAITASGSKNRFAYFCDEWFGLHKGRFKESTCVKYETILEKYIKPELGECHPEMFNTELLEKFSNELLMGNQLAPKTVKDILVMLHSILNYTGRYFPEILPQIELVYPRESRKEMRVLTRDEQSQLIRYLLDDLDACRFGILLALLTGMRIGELCALRWEKISLKENTVKISATMQRLRDPSPNRTAKTKVIIGSPKTARSERTIPLNEDAAALCRRMNPGDPAAFVLTGGADYMEPRALQYRLERYTADCGLENVHFHTLRHTFATRCVEVGFEIKSLSEILGHANTSITLDRYVHSSMELKRNNMNKLVLAEL